MNLLSLFLKNCHEDHDPGLFYNIHGGTKIEYWSLPGSGLVYMWPTVILSVFLPDKIRRED
jgi:hypothetical protein